MSRIGLIPTSAVPSVMALLVPARSWEFVQAEETFCRLAVQLPLEHVCDVSQIASAASPFASVSPQVHTVPVAEQGVVREEPTIQL